MTQSKKNILITGGAGFIPSSLADRFLENPDYFVVLVDNFLTGKKENIPQHPNCKFIHGDVNNFDDIAPIFSLYNFDYVFHYAAVVGVKRTLENPIMVLEDIYGIRNILDLSKRTGVKRVFYASSSEVYGEPVHLPQHETITPLNSRLPYAVVKNVGESYFRSYQQEYGLDYTIFRFFNTYGPKQSTDFVMSRFIRLALANKDIPVYGDGSQTRTFCFIDDNLDACMKAMESDLIVNDVANIGNGDIVTIMELAGTIIRLTNSQSRIIHLPPLEEGDMTRRQPDIAKMDQLLGRPFTSLEKGIEIILNNLR
ncbi:NAD-dependent epimerase/dehydratase family protein [Fluviicola chungangensis]|uniref:NAD-dependent epimerase/dehydratase family protein n=1 Tax=Fluviicola chungangensis TaxID=2597671 RepID=A0A556MIZ5_9FLAO|nr:NAD-dependent epimerase/dehydratase family protein [Fluviicola chungangensis]TSJ39868.1 NAD-dependent epimerase/dehydratase family protein [Fluviicola chungangensis]